MIKVGDKLPQMILKDHKGNDVDSNSLKGKKVLLSFHPLAWTPVCKDQMLSIENNLDKFDELNTVCFGLSIDSTFCKNAWAKHIGIEKLQMLSDFWPHGGYANKLGLFRETEGFTQRANVIVDEEGKVLFVKVYDIPQLPPIDEIIKACS